ncbi:MAG: hypothetical protein KDM81_06390, partial [Verrucomicrobiae bacterium]|nr:hypothetical protein [Verrucomicrobiae bacterium]MCP5520069.1 hypothetical protein [Verrucomicrobiales bacterium]
MNDKAETTRRLLQLARDRGAARQMERDCGAGLEAPGGFPRRVTRAWLAETEPPAPGWSLSWRPVVAALALVVLSLGLNWHALHVRFTPRDLVTHSMRQSFYQP